MDAHAFDGAQDLVPIVISVGIIDRTLLLFHLTIKDHLLFLRKIFGHLLFGSTKDERIQQLSQMLFSIGFSQLVDGNGKLLFEKLHRAQHPGIQKMHLRINVKRIVLQRRSAHAESIFRLQQTCCSRHLAGRILDRLRFIEQYIIQRQRTQDLDVAAQRAVRGDQDLGFRERLGLTDPGGPMMYAIGQRGGEFSDLILPVVDQGSGTNHQRPQLAFRTTKMLQHRQGLNGLSQSHVIGQNAAPSHFPQIIQPLKSGNLVRTQDGHQCLGGFDRLDLMLLPDPLVFFLQFDLLLRFVALCIQFIQHRHVITR